MRNAAVMSLVLAAAAAAAGAAALPRAAAAQAIPSYGRAETQAQDETVHGVIESVDDAWHVTLRDDRGFFDTIQLRPGTILNPRGVRLVPGMIVTIVGYNGGATLVAIEIDTDETTAVADDVYYGDGWWYPGYDYGWGPSFLGAAVIFVGGGGGSGSGPRPPAPHPYRCTGGCDGRLEPRRPPEPRVPPTGTAARPAWSPRAAEAPARAYAPQPQRSSGSGASFSAARPPAPSSSASRSSSPPSAPAHESGGASHH